MAQMNLFSAGIEMQMWRTDVDTEGMGRWDELEDSIDIYVLLCVKYLASGKLLYSTGSSAQSGMTWGSGM